MKNTLYLQTRRVRALAKKIAPEMDYEHNGRGLHCVFPCANVVVGDNVMMYYGCGDVHVGLAEFSLKEALAHVKQYVK